MSSIINNAEEIINRSRWLSVYQATDEDVQMRGVPKRL